ncbi:CDF family Co(II)/Ni(II) efflux transporter DmeF [bacterium]|nr:CDF family Co(II)/Ni(II) efflux transporter DmeF [bacterium]
MTERVERALTAREAACNRVFGQDQARSGERRTAIVVIVTAVMMVVEIAAGVVYGSMALLADGLHMASHAAALTVTLCAYVIARRYAADSRFSFGTGKINALAGLVSAVLLAGFAALMVVESIGRIFAPVEIHFDQAIMVAVIGLVVNGGCALLLSHSGEDHHGHGHHHHAYEHGHGNDHHHDEHGEGDRELHRDLNLRAAYFHVLADALTSVLAIAALVAGRFAGLSILDPVIGIVGAVLVAHWSIGLMRQTGAVLLDLQAPDEVLEAVRQSIEGDDGEHQVVDLHVWSIGPGIRSAEIVVSSSDPQAPGVYRARLPASARVVHSVIEVNARAPLGTSKP